MSRKSTGKRVRFEVFKRDGFTCQYCGAQPGAGVVLVVDHIHPVASGGGSGPENLITACEPCNQGKAAKHLGDRIVRPDADLMYLEAQQEAAELKRWQEASELLEQQKTKTVAHLQRIWTVSLDIGYEPAASAVLRLLDRYGPEVAAQALRVTGEQVERGRCRAYAEEWMPYAVGVAKNLVKGMEEKPASAPEADPLVAALRNNALGDVVPDVYAWAACMRELQATIPAPVRPEENSREWGRWLVACMEAAFSRVWADWEESFEMGEYDFTAEWAWAYLSSLKEPHGT